MILAEVRNYLAEHKRVALADMVYRFEADAEALRGMLAMLERKGRVRKLSPGTGCSRGCNQCDSANVELFEWIDTEGG
jgi:putative ferrous iron transport protein C